MSEGLVGDISRLRHIRRTGTGTVVDCRVSVVLILGQ